MDNIILENNFLIISEELKYKFKNLDLLKLALTHSTKQKLDNFSTNERLEFLKSCNCKEYSELELIIKTKGSKVY